MLYPPDLTSYVMANWPSAHPLAVPPGVLDEALAASFHASLMVEEARPTRFRLLLTRPDQLPIAGAPNEGVLRLLFDRRRTLHPDELRRLAPAAAFETSLIGACPDAGALSIWGIAHSGPAWLAPTWGGRELVPNWTYDPIIHVTGPGQIAIRCAGQLIGALDQGELVDAMMDVFESDWLPELFARQREEIRSKHAAHQTHTTSPTMVEHSLVGRVGQQMLRRAIRLVRGARHGGLILVVDDDASAPLDGLRVKYGVQQDEPSHRFRTLLLELLAALAGGTSKESVGWDDFATTPSAQVAKLEQAVFELSRVIANLAAIDGAVILDKRFGLLGFGAEVSGELPTPPRILRALDVEGVDRRADDVESVGTRHRAAYRFVMKHPGALAIALSHDGGVSFVANRGGEVVVWEQSMGP